ncbi:hypothetical protein M422DRAFT_239269 [Sphaerobolus stellatus SS14]|nr:hypothetical protein M422DRAFT_239269 [Sphaerobolus stellatus SS14]
MATPSNEHVDSHAVNNDPSLPISPISHPIPTILQTPGLSVVPSTSVTSALASTSREERLAAEKQLFKDYKKTEETQCEAKQSKIYPEQQEAKALQEAEQLKLEEQVQKEQELALRAEQRTQEFRNVLAAMKENGFNSLWEFEQEDYTNNDDHIKRTITQHICDHNLELTAPESPSSQSEGLMSGQATGALDQADIDAFGCLATVETALVEERQKTNRIQATLEILLQRTLNLGDTLSAPTVNEQGTTEGDQNLEGRDQNSFQMKPSNPPDFDGD